MYFYNDVMGLNNTSDNTTVLVFQLPPKPQTVQGYAGKLERKRFHTVTASKSSAPADAAKPATPRRTSTQKAQRTPQVNSKWILSVVFTLTVVFDESHVTLERNRKGRRLVEQEGEDADKNR